MKCPNCGVSLMSGMAICPKCKFDSRTKDGGESFWLYNEQKNNQAGWEKEASIRAENRAKCLREMVLTTCPSVEGYQVTRQCGLVFGEATFWINDLNSAQNDIEKPGEPWSRGDRLLIGVDRLKSNARSYAIQKMKEEAFGLEANAVVGVTATVSYEGREIVASLYGTAVVIEKTEE